MAIRKTSLIDGRTHGWLEAGETGDIVVLVHGIGSDAQVWTGVMDELAGEARLLAWNLPGYGSTEALPDDAPSAGDYAAALRAFLKARGVERAHLVGHSLGAIVLAELLRGEGVEAASLVLLNPVAGAGRLDVEKREAIHRGRAEEVRQLGMEQFSARRGPDVLGPDATDAMVERHLSIMTGIPERAYLQAWAMMCGSDLFALLLELPDCPVTVVCGSEDGIAAPALVEDIASRIEGAALTRLEGVGHSPAIEAPAQVISLIRRVLVEALR